MRDVELVGVRPVAGHEQPAGEPGLEHVEACAGRRLGQLAHHHVDVSIQYALQRDAGLQLAAERLRIHAPGRAGALHQGKHRRIAYAERQGAAQHSLVADQADLEPVMSADRRDQRYETVGREVNVTDARARLVKYVGQDQVDMPAPRQQMATILGGKGGDQQVVRSGLRRRLHGKCRVHCARERSPDAPA